jgi:thiol-disulfide isomerase/thioredoxin
MVLVIAVEPGPDEGEREDVSKRNERKRAAPPAIYLVAALIAAIAGFGTVYVSFAPSDNGRGDGTDMSGPAGQGSGTGGEAATGPLAGLNNGAMAPLLVRSKPLELPAFTFADADGKPKSLADFSGKIVLLNIWATWCVPCREEMPALDRLETKLGGKDFAVVAVNIDRGGSEKAAAFLTDTGATHLALYTDPTGKLFATLKAVGMPTTLIIARDGKEIARLIGPADWASPEAVAVIEAAIAANGSGAS